MFLRKNKQNIEALISSKHYLTNILFFAFKIVLNLKKQFSSSIFSFEIILDFKKRFSLHLVPLAIGKISQTTNGLFKDAEEALLGQHCRGQQGQAKAFSHMPHRSSLARAVKLPRPRQFGHFLIFSAHLHNVSFFHQ